MIKDHIEQLRSYKTLQDSSPVAQTKDIFAEFRDRDESVTTAPISTFASIVSCPYRIVNVGMGNRPRFSRSVISRMNKGTRKHKKAEIEINAKAEMSAAKGGPPDWKSAPKSIVTVATQELVEAPEVRVALTIDKLALRGKADGLLRTNGIVIAVERKPRSRMYHPASTLQAMSYAIGGCLSLDAEGASLGAKWLISNYDGSSTRGGDITEHVCDLIKGLGQAYSELLQLGSIGGKIPDLPGPAGSKCARCEFHGDCRFRVEQTPRDSESSGEPVWMKYAGPRKHKE